MILNTANLNALFTSYSSKFKGAFAGTEPQWSFIATNVPSATETNLYAFLGQFPQLREWLGDRLIKNIKSNDYSLTNKDFESTVSVPVPKIEDDTFGVFSPMFEEMGFAAKMHPDSLVFAELKLGVSQLCYDGQFMFDTDHPVIVDGSASTKSNYDSSGGGELWFVMDTRRPIKPMIWQTRKPYNFQTFNKPRDERVFMSNEILYGVDARGAAGYGLWQLAYASKNTLNSTNFDAIVTAMQALKSDEGHPLGIKPNLLVYGSTRRAAARTLILQQKLASGADNPNFKEVDLLNSPYLG